MNIHFFLSILTILTSCNGQNTAHTADKSAAIPVGEAVPELGNSIFIVFQAADGKFWFGSDKDGLYCVDGKIILHYSTKDGLPDNRIRSIQEDKHGNIYISSLGGISKFDGHAFTTLAPVKENNWKLQPDDLWFSAVGKSGEKGPYRFDGKNLYQLEFPKHFMADDYFKRFPNNSWSPYEVYYIYKDSKGTMWFGTSNFGVCRYDGKSINWLYEDHLTNVPNGGSFGIRSILEDSNGKFWFCNTRYRFNIFPDSIIENEKVLINYKKEKGIDGIKTADGTDHIYFMSIAEDNKGDLWMATYNQGVWRYDGNKVTHYKLKDGTKDITAFSIYKDKAGDLWLGTHENGVYKFSGQSFERFKKIDQTQ
ncbi:MAG TPA: two-component regulator propeller domain-containing protein [Ignavibacteria bacterium]|nr:two-component regulator propeller domain-containing protein [Ignavibacteria bacterium]